MAKAKIVISQGTEKLGISWIEYDCLLQSGRGFDPSALAAVEISSERKNVRTIWKGSLGDGYLDTSSLIVPIASIEVKSGRQMNFRKIWSKPQGFSNGRIAKSPSLWRPVEVNRGVVKVPVI